MKQGSKVPSHHNFFVCFYYFYGAYIIPDLLGPSPGQHSSGESLQQHRRAAPLLQLLPYPVAPELQSFTQGHLAKAPTVAQKAFPLLHTWRCMVTAAAC